MLNCLESPQLERQSTTLSREQFHCPLVGCFDGDVAESCNTCIIRIRINVVCWMLTTLNENQVYNMMSLCHARVTGSIPFNKNSS